MSTAHVYMAKNAQNEQCTFKALSWPCQQQRSQLQLQMLHWFTYYQGKHELINEYSPTKVTSVPPGQKLLQMVMHRDAAELQLLDSMYFCRYPPALPSSAGTPCSAPLCRYPPALPTLQTSSQLCLHSAHVFLGFYLHWEQLYETCRALRYQLKFGVN